MNSIYKTFESSDIRDKIVTVNESYHERFYIYKQSAGGCFVIDYELKLMPTGKKSVSLFFVPSQSTSVVIESISHGIEGYILEQNEKGIEVSGFDIIIENAILHPVDYDPNRTWLYTQLRIRDLLFKYGIKRYYRSDAMVIQDSRIVHEVLSPSENIYNLASLATFSKNFDLNSIHASKVTFPPGFFTKEFISTADWGRFKIKVKVYSMGWSNRHINQASVMSDEKSGCVKAMFLINEALEVFIKDVYAQGYNLGGVMIWIIESDLVYLDKQSVIFQDEFLWFLKYLLLLNNAIKSI